MKKIFVISRRHSGLFLYNDNKWHIWDDCVDNTFPILFDTYEKAEERLKKYVLWKEQSIYADFYFGPIRIEQLYMIISDIEHLSKFKID